MTMTYRAMQVTADGTLELVIRDRPTPPSGEVLIQVEACGMCGADIADIRNAAADPEVSRVPGHEIVGRIMEIGPNVAPIWRVGQRVGVGRLAGHCGSCAQCRDGSFQLCPNQAFVGSSRDGGYAEMVLARGTGLVAIPDSLASAEAAPVLCAGLATLNALRKSGVQPADTVAVLGIGGLGHMAVQYASRMGFRVIAIGRGRAVSQDAAWLGAHEYIDTDCEDGPAQLAELGGANCLVSTVMDSRLMASFMRGVAPGGTVILLGVGRDALEVSVGHLISGERTITGSLTGTPRDAERALQLSVLADSRPTIERIPLEDANHGLERLRSEAVRYRLVLTMRDPDSYEAGCHSTASPHRRTQP
jgi:alcohol dehydrogenase